MLLLSKLMNSITATYPGFQALPKGIKQMLLISESHFFDEARLPLDLPGSHSRPHAAPPARPQPEFVPAAPALDH
jgi:hypothetical protein